MRNLHKNFYFFEFFLLIYLRKCLCSNLNISLIENNDGKVSNISNFTYNVYQNNTLDEYFKYRKDYDICDCSPKMIYYEFRDQNMTRFKIKQEDNLRLNSNEKIEKILVKSKNKNINLNFTLSPSVNNSTTLLDIYHTCKNKKEYTSDQSWGVIEVELYKSLETMEKIKFEFLKFCEPPEVLGSYITIILLFLMAVFIVAISTYSEITLELTEIKAEGEIKHYHGVLLIITGSLVLLLVFYFIKYINIFLTIFISFQIGFALYLCLKTLYEFLGFTTHKKFSNLNRKLKLIKFTSLFDMEIYSFLILILSIITVISYIITRHWMLNNLFGFCLVFTILSIFHIRSFKICAILLTSAFLYDVFWVYFSSYFFSQNVMVVAATSLNLPVKLEIPILLDDHPLKSCMFLGLGDLVLPGLIIKFCHRFDFIKKSNVYYFSGLVLYLIALLLSGIVLAVFKYPQPVLFYISPLLICGISYIAYRRGEMDIWYAELLEENLSISHFEGDNQKVNHELSLESINTSEILENGEIISENTSDCSENQVQIQILNHNNLISGNGSDFENKIESSFIEITSSDYDSSEEK
jgi:signal peptide peptidase-like 2B